MAALGQPRRALLREDRQQARRREVAVELLEQAARVRMEVDEAA